jgi:hypothetical protein
MTVYGNFVVNIAQLCCHWLKDLHKVDVFIALIAQLCAVTLEKT